MNKMQRIMTYEEMLIKLEDHYVLQSAFAGQKSLIYLRNGKIHLQNASLRYAINVEELQEMFKTSPFYLMKMKAMTRLTC